MNSQHFITIAFALALGLASITGCAPARDRGEEPHAGESTHAESGEASHDEHAGHGDERAVTLAPAAIRNAGLEIGAAGPAAIATVIEAPGEIHLNSERVLEVRPRYAGVVRELRKRIGDRVRAGEVVAVVQSNESLADYEIPSAQAGTVIARPSAVGQAVDHEEVLLTVADLTTVWADFAIYPQYLGRLRTGMPVTVVAHSRDAQTVRGTVSYVGPLLEQDTRVSSARVVLSGAGSEWQPGLFITARVELERRRVGVAVPEAAIVRTESGPAVFAVEGGRFELRAVAVGRSDGSFTEIVSGLAAGDSVVTRNAFVLKSELAKGEVSHEH